VFGRLLGPKSFDNLKGLIAHKQGFIPITFGGIAFISIATIALIAYLRSWVSNFMVDQHPFLFETLT
jgi:hypothetical protein